MENILQPGLYYINPKQYKVDVIEVGLNQVSLLGKTGGAVITKTALRSSNKVFNALEDNVLQQQAQNRADYIRKESQGSEMSLAPAQTERLNSATSDYAKSSSKTSRDRKSDKNKQETEATFVLRQHVSFPST